MKHARIHRHRGFVDDTLAPTERPKAVPIGWFGLVLPFAIVASFALVASDHPAARLAPAMMLLAIPLVILALRRRAAHMT